VYFNPAWVQKIYSLCNGDSPKVLAHLAFLWYHEISHWLREHSQRQADIGAEANLWNIACDLEINDEVPRGLSLPRFPNEIEPCVPKSFRLEDGQTAEYYYRRLQQRAQERTFQQALGGTGSPQSQRSSKGRSAVESLSEGSFNPRFWDDGSGVHGQPRPWEVSSESAEVPSLTDFDRASLREEVARRILESAKERGDVPAGWVRWAQEVYKPRVNWRERLKRVLRGAITQGFGQRLDYSFRRPHRRSGIYHPFIFPSLHGERRFHIACVVDTSGSMSDEDLSRAMAEVRGVLEQMRVRVTVIPCDAVPYEAVKVLTRSDWVKSLKELKGGGGTDMVAGLNSALLLKPKPEAVLVLTDGYTPYPEERPQDTCVVWGILVNQEMEEPPLPPCPPWSPRDIVKIPVEV
jgi:predicted metal-dependent peptidase